MEAILSWGRCVNPVFQQLLPQPKHVSFNVVEQNVSPTRNISFFSFLRQEYPAS